MKKKIIKNFLKILKLTKTKLFLKKLKVAKIINKQIFFLSNLSGFNQIRWTFILK